MRPHLAALVVFLAGSVAGAAINASRTYAFRKKISPAAKLTLESFVDQRACGDADTALDLSGASSCKTEDHAKQVCFTWSRAGAQDEVHISGELAFPGVWSATAP